MCRSGQKRRIGGSSERASARLSTSPDVLALALASTSTAPPERRSGAGANKTIAASSAGTDIPAYDRRGPPTFQSAGAIPVTKFAIERDLRGQKRHRAGDCGDRSSPNRHFVMDESASKSSLYDRMGEEVSTTTSTARPDHRRDPRPWGRARAFDRRVRRTSVDPAGALPACRRRRVLRRHVAATDLRGAALPHGGRARAVRRVRRRLSAAFEELVRSRACAPASCPVPRRARLPSPHGGADRNAAAGCCCQRRCTAIARARHARTALHLGRDRWLHRRARRCVGARPGGAGVRLVHVTTVSHEDSSVRGVRRCLERRRDLLHRLHRRGPSQRARLRPSYPRSPTPSRRWTKTVTTRSHGRSSSVPTTCSTRSISITTG